MKFESLERRHCLSAPTITSFQIDSVEGPTVTISGYVTDEEDPKTVGVELSGVLSDYVNPDSSGYFTYSSTAGGVGTIVAVATDDEGLTSDPVQVVLESDVPSVSALTITYEGGTEITVTGQVVDEDPEYAIVCFFGAVDSSAHPDANGNFSLTTFASLGTLAVCAEDAFAQESATVYDEVTSEVPSIESLSVTYHGKTEVTITGHVIDEDPAGLTVYLCGAVGDSASTDQDGNFSVHVLSASLGTVWADTSDPWGQASDEATVEIVSDEPQIVNFTTEVAPLNTLVVEGDVIDEEPAGLTVQIEWLDEVYEVTVDSLGHFYWSISLEEDDEGWVSAITYDWWGQESNRPQDLIIPN